MAARVVFIGMDAAGKTTIAYKLKLDQVVTTIPTIGFNVEKISLHVNDRKLDTMIWDIGLRGKARPLLRHYLTNKTNGIIFVIDSTDPERLQELEEEYLSILVDSDELDRPPVAFFLNKQDLPAKHRVTEAEVSALPGVQRLKMKSEIEMFPVSAVTGMGLQDAMTWLGEAMVRRDGSLIKPSWGLSWLYDSVKRILCFGA